jgi:hypothetical protein
VGGGREDACCLREGLGCIGVGRWCLLGVCLGGAGFACCCEIPGQGDGSSVLLAMRGFVESFVIAVVLLAAGFGGFVWAGVVLCCRVLIGVCAV